MKYLSDYVDAFEWEEIEDGIRVYGYNGVKNRVAIPESIQGKPVVEIGSAGRDYEAECDILIPRTVKRFAPDVFTGNHYYGNRKSWFEDFCLTEDHPWIKWDGNFLYDQGGKRLVRCFDNEIQEVTIPQGVTIIGTGAFYKCQKIKSITLPEGLEIIEDKAFLNCTGMPELRIPDTVRSIGYNALAFANPNRASFVRINVPQSLEEVRFSSKVIWDGFESHPNFTVQDNMLLSKDGKQLVMLLATEPVTDVLIPEGVEEILPHAFAESGSMKKLTLATTVKTIREFAFGEHKVKTLRIPAALETIEENGFDYSKLGSVIVDKKNTHFYTDKVCLFRKLDGDKLELVCCFRNKLEEYQIPEGTASICSGAFMPCEQLKDLTFPESLEIFDETAIPYCVKNPDLPAGLRELRRNPSRSIAGAYAKLAGEMVFWEDNVLYQRTEEGLVALYCDKKMDQLSLKEGTVRVDAHAFRAECGKLTFPASLRRIENGAFRNAKVSCVEFAEGLRFIGKNAFAGCQIENLTIPASVRYIHPNAFDKCPLKSYQVAEGSETYSARDGILYSADGKELLDVPAQLACDEFVVPETAEDIATAFLGCEHIKTIRIHAGVRNLWRMAVVGCRRLKHLYVDGNPDYVSDSFIDFDFPIRIHADPGSSVVDFVEFVQSRTYGNSKLSLVVNGMEDLDKLTDVFQLLPNKTGVSICRCLKKQANIVVPATIGKYTVTMIGKNAFAENWGQEVIETVELPDTITCIAEGAFDTCRKMHTVKLKAGIKTIERKAFHNCAVLSELILPEGVEEIGDCAFFGCEALRLLSIPASVKKISPWIFADSSYSNPNSFIHKDLYVDEKTLFHAVPGSYAEAFLKDYRLEKWGKAPPLTIISVLPTAGEATGEEREALKYMDYSIGEDGTVSVSFKDYPKEQVVNAVIPATIMGMPVTELNGMGSMPREIVTLTLPASIRKISGLYRLSFYSGGKEMRELRVAEDNAAYWTDGDALYSKDRSVLIHMMNYQLDRYSVHPDTKIIEEGAFGCFGNLKTLILPEGLREIRSYAFDSCPLENIQGVEKVPAVADGVLQATPWFNNQSILFNGSELTKYADVSRISYQVPDGTTRIGPSAFYLRNAAGDQLEEIILPDSVTELGPRAFMGRKKLKTIHFGNGIKTLSGPLMTDCTAIEKLHIPASVETIGVDALPDTQTTWRSVERAALREITVDENNPCFMAKDGILYSKDGGTLLKVPAAYPASAITVPDSVHTIGEAAFKNLQYLKNVVLPASVKTIGKQAFAKCELLSAIDLPNVETLGDTAFYECKALTEVTLVAKEIGNNTFTGCGALASLNLHNTVVIGNSAFRKCTSLKSVELPDSLEIVRDGAFASCGLSRVTLPRSVKKVDNESFSGCPDITVYDTIDPDAKAASAHKDDVNGYPNSLVGFMGIGVSRAMWQCAANHDWADHEITVRSAETDEIKYKVSMYSDPKQRGYYCLLTSSWGKNATFHFAALDEFFPSIKGVPNKLRVALNRLRYPVELSEAQKQSYIAYLVRAAKDLVKDLIDKDDMETFLFCAPFGILKKNNIDELIEYATKLKAVEFVAWLMEYKNDNFAGKKSASKLPSLSAKIEEPWQAPKSGTSKIGRYKGTDTEVVFPEQWKGKPLTGVAGTTSKVPDNYRNIISVVLPEGYTTIGDYAFYGCTNLEKITLPSTLESIGKDAFAGCVKLQEIILPDAVTEIGMEAFQQCQSLAKLRISPNMTYIPERAFYHCDALQEVELPRKLRSVNKDSFYCKGLQRVVVHSSRLYGSGQCFQGAVQVHAYASAEIHVYGVQKRHLHPMTIAEQAADLLLTVKLTGKDGSETLCNFFGENCEQTMQKTGSGEMTRLVSAAANGKALADALNEVYGGKLLLSANNRAEAKILEAADVAGAATITVTEEKKHPDGDAVTVFTYTAAEKLGTMKAKESLAGEKKRSGYVSYYNAYFQHYGDHVDNEKENKAEEKEDDGFVDITESADAPAPSVFKTDAVETLAFQGKIFVLTGFGAEEEQKMTDLITGKGGEVKSSVVLKTNYLVVNEEYDHETSKYKKALELKEKGKEIRIISSEQFYELA